MDITYLWLLVLVTLAYAGLVIFYLLLLVLVVVILCLVIIAIASIVLGVIRWLLYGKRPKIFSPSPAVEDDDDPDSWRYYTHTGALHGGPGPPPPPPPQPLTRGQLIFLLLLIACASLPLTIIFWTFIVAIGPMEMHSVIEPLFLISSYIVITVVWYLLIIYRHHLKVKAFSSRPK